MSYSTGTVYKIICYLDDRIIYIGSTFNQLRHRWQCHKKAYKQYLDDNHGCITIFPYFEKFGIENFKIMKIKDYECYRENKADSRHLHAFEQLWINRTKGCVNKQAAFSISKLYKKEWREANKDKMKEYYEANKEKLSKQNKEYREANKDKILEYQKEYREANKERISVRSKKYYEANKDKASERGKEYREVNKEKISEYQKEYREANKERISEQKKEYRDANKDKISKQNKEYREANKERLLKKDKERYEKNKDKTLERNKQRVNCSICDKDLARASLRKHMKNIHSSI